MPGAGSRDRNTSSSTPTTREALVAGFRPCKRCRPLDPEAGTPEWASRLVARVEADPAARITDADLRAEGLDPAAVRRWFQKTHGMTFQAYCRARRLGDAFVALRSGERIDDVVFDHGWGSHSGFRTAFGKLAGAPPGEAAEAPDGSLIRMTWLDTPVGPLVAGATDEALCLLEYPDRRMLETQLDTLRRRFGRPLAPGDSPLFAPLRAQLDEYFAGRRRAFDLPLEYPGSPFQRRVWDALRRIPYGETRTYAELAREIGAPGAARAVGTRQRRQPPGHHHPVPPGDRRQWRSRRLRRRPLAQAASARDGGRPPLSPRVDLSLTSPEGGPAPEIAGRRLTRYPRTNGRRRIPRLAPRGNPAYHAQTLSVHLADCIFVQAPTREVTPNEH